MLDGEDDLFAYARRTDPKTSHDAASSMKDMLPQLQAAVLGSLRRAGQRGRTLDELIEDTGIEKVTISPRRLGRSHRHQIVWLAAEFAAAVDGGSQ
ncbi:hypothetical protein BRDID11004_59790 [Bradyrhizobium diazoefficiens]|uniref:Uncharacterized protein n=1 Tax=Bradyrhizobium diazoefficiens TaxID=1355477 RepID=A0A810AF73_9BRAD|nr:hypothetical protein [Bradyrhizobium diazoefficiens]BBZ93122.1 hypothetical protein F07S3_29550 [Bradyrhizobium diazoefficiens]BCA10873.1 hypothetical protein BDHF08_27200 [Bradyrhizobium diazoefficiens]BCE55208.1 hypothetical protein XF5B_27200 [Bradyrhizobium diazoefficiens]BCE63942.1 hypothetical protein XF6B_27410 [Bradyrhizobium diazoefficiens]